MFFKNYKLNMVVNVFIILQLTFIFLISNDEIIKLNENKMMQSYVCIENSINMYYISRQVLEDNENMAADNIKINFQNKINDISKENGINGVGYYFKADAVEKKKHIECKAYYLNPTLRKIKYNLRAGKWFSNNEDKPQAIIGRELQKYYKIGDYIIVSDNESQTSIEAQVIGYLGKLNMIMDLNVATDDGNMSNQLMLSNVENVVLTNVRMLQDWENSEPSIYNVIEVKNSNAITKLYNSNEITPFDVIKKNTESSFIKKEYTSGLYIMLLFAILLVSLLFIIYSDTNNKLKFMLICYVCGYTRAKMILDSICSNILNFTVAILATIFIKIIMNGADLLNIGMENLILIFAIFAIISIIQSVIILYDTRNLTIHKIKEHTS